MKSYPAKSIIRTITVAAALVAPVTASYAQETVINGMDFGPLAKFVGTWKTVASGGTDVAPGQAGSKVGKGGPAVEPYYETLSFEPAADAKNASDQYLAAMYYKLEVFRKRDNKKFHDQRGYLLYDKKSQMVYDTFCIPRGVCVVAEGKPGSKMTLTSQSKGVAESQYMVKNDDVTGFTITFDISGDTLKYAQTTGLNVYGKPFSHVDTSTLSKVN
ncbi:heme-binding beta-barrel domain-containing protein [Paraburkholderia sp. SIMBA_054]|uniref:heme-binding beta-barrel domain-containing protein n=1 Tax=Paraburkholderia sp. SIMBA_054 TaxID=3085795 RepID=UPI00397817BF